MQSHCRRRAGIYEGVRGFGGKAAETGQCQYLAQDNNACGVQLHLFAFTATWLPFSTPPLPQLYAHVLPSAHF